MKTRKLFGVVALAVLLLAGTAGLSLAQSPLVSGEPYPGFFEGVVVETNGPVTTEIVGHSGLRASDSSKVTRQTIVCAECTPIELAELYPEAFIGAPEGVGAGGEMIRLAR
jgi:hypothetical protein